MSIVVIIFTKTFNINSNSFSSASIIIINGSKCVIQTERSFTFFNRFALVSSSYRVRNRIVFWKLAHFWHQKTTPNWQISVFFRLSFDNDHTKHTQTRKFEIFLFFFLQMEKMFTVRKFPFECRNFTRNTCKLSANRSEKSTTEYCLGWRIKSKIIFSKPNGDREWEEILILSNTVWWCCLTYNCNRTTEP